MAFGLDTSILAQLGCLDNDHQQQQHQQQQPQQQQPHYQTRSAVDANANKTTTVHHQSIASASKRKLVQAKGRQSKVTRRTRRSQRVSAKSAVNTHANIELNDTILNLLNATSSSSSSALSTSSSGSGSGSSCISSDTSISSSSSSSASSAESERENEKTSASAKSHTQTCETSHDESDDFVPRFSKEQRLKYDEQMRNVGFVAS